ncbi:antitoxin VbhA family protein [Pseudomonas alabamensis]|uniref:antitoxin VbhA family protein n=1 Tax=Pseudomonas alabamensis TaxID=3064349 RepID=UPI0021D937A4|nr:antitoxin VbhA family protein [Pseudomonas entomophila]
MNTSESIIIIIPKTGRERRRKAVEYARVSIRLEGFVLGAEEKRRAQAFVGGDLTLAELVQPASTNSWKLGQGHHRKPQRSAARRASTERVRMMGIAVPLIQL